MRITVNRDELAAAVNWASKGIAKRVHVPVLAGMLAEVSGGKLTLSGFDYDTAARAFVTGDNAADGKILVNGAELVTACRNMPKGKRVAAEILATFPPAPVIDPAGHVYSEEKLAGQSITARCSCNWSCSYIYDGPGAHARHLEELGKAPAPTMTIACEGITANLAGMDMSEYPALPEIGDHAGTFAGETFAAAFTRVARAAGADDTLPVLTEVQLQLTAESATFAATDRYRLAYDVADWTPADLGMEPMSVMIPARAAGLFVKAAKGAGKIAVHYSCDDVNYPRVALVTDTRQLIARGHDTSGFPRWPNLVRADDAHAVTVTVDAGELAAAMERAGKARATRHDAARITFAGDVATVETRGDDVVTSHQTVAVTEVSGDAGTLGTVGFNPDYLASMLAGYSGAVEIGFAKGKPAQLRSAAGDTFRALVMEIRLS